MGAAVRIDANAFADERFELLGELAGYNRHEALGRVARLWSYCTDKETDLVEETIVRAYLGASGVDAICGAGLAEREGGMVRIRGGERLFWLRDKRKAGSSGGKARASKSKQQPSKDEAGAKHPPSREQAEAKQDASTPQANGKQTASESNPLALALANASTKQPPQSPPGGDRAPPGIAGEGALSRTKRKLLNRWRDEAWRLWELQDELRRESIAGARKLRPTAEALLRVADRLEAGNSPEDCERVLRVCAAQAKRDATAADWFNGETNWRPKAFGIKLGMADTVLGSSADSAGETAENQGALASLFRGSDTPSFGDRDRAGDSR